MVDSSKLQNLNEDVESYSVFLTVDAPNNGNMFFWFFPAEENPETAPVVIWLQGGPGGSSMFGALKLHGPVITTVDENNQLSGVEKNPYSWGRKHNMLYIDNPVGAGFSFSDKMPETQMEVTNNLYEFLQQWYTLFPMYQSNPFYPFGESFAGIGLSKGIEGVALVHGEESVPLLEKLIKVVRHFHLCLRHLVAEGEASSNRVVNVEHVVFSAPRVRVLLNPTQLVVLVHGGDNRSMELEGPEHGRATRATLKPDHHRGSFWTLLRWEEPEEHVAIVWCIHRKEARVAFDILVQVLELAGVDHGHLPTSLHISTLNIGGEVELGPDQLFIRHRKLSLHLWLEGPICLNTADKSKE